MAAVAANPHSETGEIMRKQNLFEIGAALEQIFDTYHQMQEDGEDADSWLSQELEKYFHCTAEELDGKVDAYCAVISQRKAYAQIRRSEADRLDALAKTDENTVERLKRRLMDFMKVFGYQKLETKTNKVRRQNNGGVLPLQWLLVEYKPVDGSDKPARMVSILEGEELPPFESIPKKYIRYEPVIDTEAVRADLKTLSDCAHQRREEVELTEEELRAEQEAMSVIDLAQFGERGEHLRFA